MAHTPIARHHKKRSFPRTIGKAMLIAATSATLSVAGASAADLNVEVSQYLSLKLQQSASSIIVGNPAIADVSVEDSNQLFVLGRAYGKTSLTALDADGNPIVDIDVNVVAPRTAAVTLTRGPGQISYNCTPRCERALDPSDSPEFFEPFLKNTRDTASFAKDSAE